MDDQYTTPNRLKVSYYDGAVAFGGSLQVLAMLFASLDRTRIDPELIACTPPQQLEGRFETKDIGLLHTPRLHYVQRKRWLARFNQHRLIRKVAAYIFSLASTIANIPTQYQIYRHLRAKKPDVFHINNSFTPMLPALLLRIPVIWHMHGTPFPPSLWERYLLNHVKQFVTISDHIAAQAIQARIPGEKIITIQNPAPPTLPPSEEIRTTIRTRYSVPQNHKLVVHVGRLIPWKGQLEFLKSIKLALKRRQDLSALVVGDDSEKLDSSYKKQLLQFVRENHLDQHVQFTGQVNNPRDYMAAADIVVHSSIAPEPFGLVIVEAMTTGTAVIASSLGAGPEIIQDGVNGLLANPTQDEELEQKIVCLLGDDKKRTELGRSGQITAKQLYGLKTYSERLENIYISICCINYVSDGREQHQRET